MEGTEVSDGRLHEFVVRTVRQIIADTRALKHPQIMARRDSLVRHLEVVGNPFDGIWGCLDIIQRFSPTELMLAFDIKITEREKKLVKGYTDAAVFAQYQNQTWRAGIMGYTCPQILAPGHGPKFDEINWNCAETNRRFHVMLNSCLSGKVVRKYAVPEQVDITGRPLV